MDVSRETIRLSFIFCAFWALFSVIITGCGEDAIRDDISSFNKIIEKRTDIKSAREVMIIYFNYLPVEKDSDYTIEEEDLTTGRTRVTLICDNLLDDSMKGLKLVMITNFDGTKWKVVIVQRNWKCYEGRGHTNWGTEPCN
jgi:hypothetical protein